MKNIGLKIGSFLVASAIVLSMIGSSYGADDLANQKNSVDQKIDETKKKLDNVKGEKQDTEKEVKSIAEQISDYETQIKTLDSEIGNLTTSTQELQKKIDELDATYIKNKDLLEQRLVALYEAGNTSFLDFILGSEDLTDFISKFTLAEELTSYDQELIEKVEKESKELENLHTSLNTKLDEVQGKKDSRSGVVKQLAVVKGQKETEVDQLENKEEELESHVKEFEKEAKALDAQMEANRKALEKKYQEALKKKQEEEANKPSGGGSTGKPDNGGGSSGSTEKPDNGGGNGSSSSKGFIRPIKGYNISTGWYYSDGRVHGAVDYSTKGKTGIPIYSVADGIVIFSGWGGGDSYGNYVLIRHYNGLYTLYAHGSSLSVSTGQEVKQGQTIMASGNTGNSTGPHLHFEVRTSSSYSSRVNPQNYLP